MSEKPAKLEKLPKIITQLPGPKARQTLELDRRRKGIVEIEL